ncbi:MAG: SAM-dependent chlorinase/fluorinase [Flavobacteriales bacterium]|nr:SAM-dependent chlorinase/fluorinase [Flavobacteriales bacterium]
MRIVTLTTDLGNKDYYTAAIKGALLRQVPELQIVDVSHEVNPFDTRQAAYILRGCWQEFPKGTIHIIGVNSDVTVDEMHVIVEHKGHYFISADNGVYSLLFDHRPENVYELNLTQDTDENTFPTKNLFAKAAAHLARGGTPEVIGRRVEELKTMENFRAVVEENVIKGSVIYIDVYGNVMTNISLSLFREVGKGRDFAIMLRRASLDIRKIHNQYNEVPPGTGVALFNHMGFLEIAINKGAPGSGGGANSLFGLKINDIVRIEFNANQNR